MAKKNSGKVVGEDTKKEIIIPAVPYSVHLPSPNTINNMFNQPTVSVRPIVNINDAVEVEQTGPETEPEKQIGQKRLDRLSRKAKKVFGKVFGNLKEERDGYKNKVAGLEAGIKKAEDEYVILKQNVLQYSAVVDYLIGFVSKPQYAGRIAAEDARFLEEVKKGEPASLPAYARLLSLLSKFVDEDAAKIEMLLSEDKKYKSLDADFLREKERLVGGIKAVAGKYAIVIVELDSAKSRLESIADENKKFAENAAQRDALLEKTFGEFERYISEIEESME